VLILRLLIELLLTPDHDQQHLELFRGMQGVGNIGQHDQHVTGGNLSDEIYQRK